MIYDITRTVSPRTHPWPGDTAYSVQAIMQIKEGASVNLMTMTTTCHIGTHADAYYHYEDDGEHPAQMPLGHYIGRARVVTVSRYEGALTVDDFVGVDLVGGERLLIHSHVSDLPDDEWADVIPYLSVELIEHLASLDYKLIGLDSPSVDDYNSKTLPCHHALRKNGLVNLEHLQLRDVPDGDYELIALPLKLDDACGSPVRAILRPLSD
ncbi:MAG: cyclase family protein [Phototrophicaceae bacterium]